MIRPTLTDRLLAGVAPTFALKRFNARLALHMSGQYAGARSNRTALKSWKTNPGSADADTLGDLPTLRSRSRDLLRNNPIASGARATSKSNIVGTGLKARAKINRLLLDLTEEQAEKWERYTETIFDLWASSKLSDITRTQNFYEQQGLVFNSAFESGDSFVLRRTAKDGRAVVPLALQVTEADRCGTPQELSMRPEIRDGVKIDADGAAQSYFFFNEHPGDYVIAAQNGWVEVPAYGAKSGEQMVLHVFDRLRPGLSRGVPYLAPVIELLKQLDRYSEAELMKAVVSSFFTVFLKTEDDSGLAAATPALPGMGASEITMGSGSIVDIGVNESIETAAPANTSNFDPFFQAVVRQIGVALSIPFELLMMHFTASYSASRAALEMAAQFFRDRRVWLVRNFCAPVYEWFITEAINAGLIDAPGFFHDPVRRAAWLGCEWIGPSRIVLDPLKEWKAEEVAVSLGARTLEAVIIERGGGDFESTTAQRAKEHAARAEAKLEPEVLASLGTPPQPEPEEPEEEPALKPKSEPSKQSTQSQPKKKAK